jgi:tryptophanyl-tRNA synthetase
MDEFKTERYTITVVENGKGGPNGYESRYVENLGEEPSASLLDMMSASQTYSCISAKNGLIKMRNQDVLRTALEKDQKIGIASGFKPSGAFHFGHLLTSSTVSYFQKTGCKVCIPVADLECRFDTAKDFAQSNYWAADNLLDWGASGISLDDAHVYLQSEEHRVGILAYLVARGLDFSVAADTYSFEKLHEGFPFVFAGLTQVGDILLPQHKDIGSDISVMVSGPDQDGHMKMTTTLTQKALLDGVDLNGVTQIPAGYYIPHIRGFKPQTKGVEPKMSSSFPEGTFYVSSGPQKLSLSQRIESSRLKFTDARTHHEQNLRNCALDLIMNLEPFHKTANLDFRKLLQDAQYVALKKGSATDQQKAAQLLHEYCANMQVSVIDVLDEVIPTLLKDQHEKRNEIFQYALDKKQGRGTKPSFWNVPDSARIPQEVRNKTQWFDIVAKMRGELKP